MSDTVLVTGVSGFIAKYVAAALLAKGYAVRGTVRTMARAEAVRESIGRIGADPAGLTFCEADLLDDAGWDQALDGVRFVQHIASPFPMAQPKDREALVPAARDGALRVLQRATAAERIVMTSSMVAMMYRANRPQNVQVREDDWTDPEWDKLSAYIVSKTRAERAAWDAMGQNKARLVAVNPGFVMGPAPDTDSATSLDLVKMLLTGAYPALPKIAFPCVDVRDVADLHVAAMTTPEVGGRRLMGAGETLTLRDMGAILREACPERARKIPKRSLPIWVTRLAAMADPNIRAVLPDLGVQPHAQSVYVTDLTGVSFRPAKESVADAGRSLIALGAA